jgi:adenylate cyclase
MTKLCALGEGHPGGIYISEDAYRQVRDRLKETFFDLGEKELKNIARPMRLFALKTSSATPTSAPASTPAGPRDATHALLDKPSSIVLPVTNMSGDLEQDHFEDGMVEDFITGLSASGSSS